MASPESPLFVYLGVVTIVGGFATIAYTWGKVAGVLAVPIQLSYVVSGAFAGLGAVAVGIALINIGAKRRDAAVREQRLRKLSTTLEGIATALNRSGADQDEVERHS